MDINELVPKNKGDVSGLPALSTLEVEAAAGIMAGLLEWLMDMNWPVARALFPVLPQFHGILVPYLRVALLSCDSIWKYNLLCLIQNCPPETAQCLEDLLARMAEIPQGEEGVTEKAREIRQWLAGQA
ncbi:MAG: DUF5071 domain-containing protein [Oxalobacter sp.]|nr:DUF5071 domain-containing protein [Oxalobacter sp.]